MIDIFQQPDLYIADITVSIDGCSIPFKEYLKIHRVRKLDEHGKLVPQKVSQTIKCQPVLLLDGAFPSQSYQQRYIEKHFDRIPHGKYPYEVEFSNVKFSSRIQYYFES